MSLRRLAKEFSVFDYTIEIIKNPEKYFMEYRVNRKWISKIPRILFIALLYFMPNYNWILEKKK